MIANPIHPVANPIEIQPSLNYESFYRFKRDSLQLSSLKPEAMPNFPVRRSATQARIDTIPSGAPLPRTPEYMSPSKQLLGMKSPLSMANNAILSLREGHFGHCRSWPQRVLDVSSRSAAIFGGPRRRRTEGIIQSIFWTSVKFSDSTCSLNLMGQSFTIPRWQGLDKVKEFISFV